MTVQIPAAGTYAVDPERSEIRFSVKHRFGTGTVRGRFAVIEGVLVVADPVTGSSVTVSADAASFESGNAGRDTKVRSGTFLGSERYPRITFRSRSLENTSAGSWRLRGALEAHGVAVETEFDLREAKSTGDSVDIVADGTVDRYAHGITAMKGMAGRHLSLEVTLHAERRGV